MSRCFPFPPPGYEKNARTDDTDLLTKEKRTEKRHKKDKKDKEKREGEERKEDKERSEGKHKEKKDRKEKHKDRKDKDRDKEKKRTSDQKNILRPPEGQNGKKLGSNCLQSGEATDSKFLLKLGKGIRDEGGARENGMFQSSTVTGQKTTDLPGSSVESNIGNSTEGRDKYKEKVDRNVNGERKQIKARGVENAFIQYFSGMDQKMVGVAGPMDKDVKRQREGKKKHKHKDNDSREDRPKDRDREKKGKSNDKDKTKEKEKEEKAKEKGPYKEQPVSGKSSKGDHGKDIHNIKPSYLLNEGSKSSAYNGNLNKRKELELNGFLHDDDIRPNKWPRTISSFHQLVENGSKLEPCQTAHQAACEKQVAAIIHLVDNTVFSGQQILENGRELKPKPNALQSASKRQGAANGSKEDKQARINGLIKAQQTNVCWSKPLSTPVGLKEKVEASAKPPHRDFKYLSQILSVPQVAVWSDFDDQEWLFSSDNLLAENAKAGSSEVDRTLQVWAEALQIESLDVTALPYVIPF